MCPLKTRVIQINLQFVTQFLSLGYHRNYKLAVLLTGITQAKWHDPVDPTVNKLTSKQLKHDEKQSSNNNYEVE